MGSWNSKNRKPTGNITECIDEGLYSRQLYVVGVEGMKQMATTNVLIYGLDGLGLEIAKNIVLAGVHSVTLYDPHKITGADLSTHYYATADDVGKFRTEVSHVKLAELNSYVMVKVLPEKSKPEPVRDFVSQFDVIVLAQASHEMCSNWGDACHESGVKLVVANTAGLFGRVFCDFGPTYTVTDIDGKENASLLVEHIEKSDRGVVRCVPTAESDLCDITHVTFQGVVGMTELNGCEPREITVLSPTSFSIGDTSQLSDYISGGVCNQVKLPIQYTFLSYREAYRKPEGAQFQCAVDQCARQLHLCFAALDEYARTAQSDEALKPSPWNREQADRFVASVRKVNETQLTDSSAYLDQVDAELCSLFAMICAGQCCPIQAVIGGFAAQEVMKACTRKFIPLCQWWYLDASTCLPKRDLWDELTETTVRAKKTRYDGQIAIFGHTFQERLAKGHYFIPGAGAVGCELLKNLAMMGVGANEAGKITVTDMDSIERSNLNRQFLFRPHDIGRMKSVVAVEAVKRMNPELNIEAHENRVGEQTENVYHEQFYASLDAVLMAVDSIPARQYINECCIRYSRPAINPGTMGARGSLQVILPHLTSAYSDDSSGSKGYPSCTLKYFPYLIEHTLQWARDLFEELFAQPSVSLASYLREPEKFMETVCANLTMDRIQMLETLAENLTEARPKTFAQCVAWARLLWHNLFIKEIMQVRDTYPEDHVTESGVPFWSASKRRPNAFEFDLENPLHMNFVLAAANLRAHLFQIEPCRKVAEVKAILKSVNVPQLVSSQSDRIPTTEEEMEQQLLRAQMEIENDTERVNKVRAAIESAAGLSTLSVNVIEFEKDDDSNFHMDFIVAASNQRAACYGIAPADRLRSKMIAGRIIPAIATSTSVVSGLVCLELYKLTQKHNERDYYRSSVLDLRVPSVSFFKPPPAPVSYYGKTPFTIWDQISLTGPMTLEDLFNEIKNRHQLRVTILLHGSEILYAFYMPKQTVDSLLSTPMERLVEDASQSPIPTYVETLFFEIRCANEQDESFSVPPIRYRIKA